MLNYLLLTGANAGIISLVSPLLNLCADVRGYYLLLLTTDVCCKKSRCVDVAQAFPELPCTTDPFAYIDSSAPKASQSVSFTT